MKKIKARPKPVGKQCDLCHQYKADVETRIDPYCAEILNEQIERDMCDDCCNQRRENV